MTFEFHMLRGAWLVDVLIAMRSNPNYWDVLQIKPDHVRGGSMGRFDQTSGKFDTQAGESPSASLPRIREIRIPPEGSYPGEYLLLTPRWQSSMEQQLEAEGLMHEFRAFERAERYTELAYVLDGKAVWGKGHRREIKYAALLLSRSTPVERLEG